MLSTRQRVAGTHVQVEKAPGRHLRVTVFTVKGLLTIAATVAVVVGLVYVLNRSEPPPVTAPGEAPGSVPVAPSAESLRNQLLHATGQQMGVAPIRGVWGVVMERGYPKGTATVIALADGTASLYLSTGGSVAGGKAYPPAHAAALKLCGQAADSLAETISAHEFPSPAKGRVRFYVLTTDGVRVAEGDLLAPAREGGRDALAPLVAAGDAVLDALKEATSKGLIR
jgi:hypothetical protein